MSPELRRWTWPSGLKLRQDGEHWTAFDAGSGSKVTLSPRGTRLSRSQVPELCDLSITDACSARCHFCYRDSTPEGQHADVTWLRWIAGQLASAGTFEVALGGGEPTEHPAFKDILATFTQAGLLTNFTTRRPDWVFARWNELSPLFGALAVSVSVPGDLRRLLGQVEQAQTSGQQVSPTRLNLHIIPALTRREHTETLLRMAASAGLRVTLLGYKAVGRAPQGAQARVDPEWWPDLIPLAREAGLALSIDTPLAEQGHRSGALLDQGVQRQLYHTREGAYSLFIDGVKQTLARSSYEQTGEQPCDAHWLERYQTLALPDE